LTDIFALSKKKDHEGSIVYQEYHGTGKKHKIMSYMALRKNTRFSLKEKYSIEPTTDTNGWVLRKEGSVTVMKEAKNKLMLLYFAENKLERKDAELKIFDSNGMLEEIIDFKKYINKS